MEAGGAVNAVALGLARFDSLAVHQHERRSMFHRVRWLRRLAVRVQCWASVLDWPWAEGLILDWLYPEDRADYERPAPGEP